MKNLIFLALTMFLLAGIGAAQDTGSSDNGKSSAEKPKRVVFRATKSQITEAQAKLKAEGRYSGEADGRMNAAFRTSVKSFQGENGLAKSGSLNRATLEKMGIALTESQQAIPIPESSYARPKTEKVAKAAETEKPKRGPVFRATKDQINAAQRMLKEGGMYDGDETGKLDAATRNGLKKYQEANGLKVTGTLNQATLEKMGIELTDRQKANAASSN